MVDIPKTAFGIVLIMLCILAAMLAYKATHSDSKFDFAQAFLDADGKTSMARICTFTALAVSTWALVALVQTDKLTEWFFTIYIGAFVLNGTASKWIDKK